MAALARLLLESCLNLAAIGLGTGLSPSALSSRALGRTSRFRCSVASLLVSADNSAFVPFAGTGGGASVVRPGVAWAAASPVISDRLASVRTMIFFNSAP